MTRTTDDLLDGAIAAARAGAAVLVEGLRRPLQVSQKSERTSIVTWADVTAQEAIVRVIGERFPAPARTATRHVEQEPSPPQECPIATPRDSAAATSSSNR